MATLFHWHLKSTHQIDTAIHTSTCNSKDENEGSSACFQEAVILVERDAKQPVAGTMFILPPSDPVVKILPFKGVQVQSLVRELRFHLPCCAGKKKKKKTPSKIKQSTFSFCHNGTCKAKVPNELGERRNSPN